MRIAQGVVVALGLIMVFAGPARAQEPGADTALPVIGQRISLDLKGVDILDVLKLLSQKSGLNFIAGRNVSGRVTIFVSDVDVWEAFQRIIAANDLAYERDGGIVTVMMARDYELLYGERFQERKQNAVRPLRYAKVIQVAAVLNQLKSSIGQIVADEATNTLIMNDVPARLEAMQALVGQLDRPMETRVYPLNYADAEKLKEKIKELLSPVGTVSFDARTNKAIISDLSDVLPKIDRVVRAFDTPDAQVLIEAKIIKVDLTDEMDLGIDWQRVFSGVDTQVRNNFDSISGDIIGGSVTGAALKLVASTRSNATVLIEALKKLARTETLSNPRLMVANNQEAKILVGTKEAFVTVTTTVPSTGSTVSSPEIKFVDVGTKLYVTPNIKPDGQIQMKIRPEVSTSAVTTFAGNRIPIISSTEAETNVLVKSGVTLIIGGLISDKTDRTDNRVPGLGDVPILGFPFRGSNKTKTKTELVLFLTPQIIMPDGSAFVPPPPGRAPDLSLPEVVLQDPVPASYRYAVRQRLQGYLTSQFLSAALQPGSVVVSFVLNHDGQMVTDGQEITSPQGVPFIQAAMEALAKAQPFPPFPQGSSASEVRFRLAVEYSP